MNYLKRKRLSGCKTKRIIDYWKGIIKDLSSGNESLKEEV